jgi:hypothetical protein
MHLEDKKLQIVKQSRIKLAEETLHSMMKYERQILK